MGAYNYGIFRAYEGATVSDLIQTSDVCEHTNLPPVPFDEKASKGLSAPEVRSRWPRLYQICPDCKAGVICYASFRHYIAGDW